MGLCNPGILLSSLKGPDERINFLRWILLQVDSPSLNQEAHTYLIRFFESDRASLQGQWEVGRVAGIATGKTLREASPRGSSAEDTYVRWAPQALLKGKSFGHEVSQELPHEVALQLGSRRNGFTLDNQYDGIDREYRYIYGNSSSAAIYVNTALGGQGTVALRPPNFEDLIWCLEFDLLDIQSMLYFFDGVAVGLSSEGRTFRALNTASEVYRALPMATVSTRALSYPLYMAHWVSSPPDAQVRHNRATFDLMKNREKTVYRIDQNIAFACVAWMEAGVDLELPSLKRVFALAYEDSIYVSMQLACDPWEVPNSYELKRVAGNVGKPGLTLLIPPDDPVVPTTEKSSWRVLSISDFKGLAEDHFSKTSMHLSFTEYYIPLVQAGDEQGQDSRVYFL
ncbi:hypothetical protein SLS53_009230 [Cytospora paraplurivora]|uniref:Uncharacterized protein n=1 Tax=Cytospora paraplurivora TaxID=2898453 RepID=A0AAN9TZ40_9PEZI